MKFESLYERMSSVEDHVEALVGNRNKSNPRSLATVNGGDSHVRLFKRGFGKAYLKVGVHSFSYPSILEGGISTA